MKLDLLWSDRLVWAMTLSILGLMIWGLRRPYWRKPWRQLLTQSVSAAAIVILFFYMVIGLLDSIHFENYWRSSGSEVHSLLDYLVSPLELQTEKTYSAPFAAHAFTESTFTLPNGEKKYGFPPLKYVHGNAKNLLVRITSGLAVGVVSGLAFFAIFVRGYSRWQKQTWYKGVVNIICGKTNIAWRSIWITFFFLWILLILAVFLASHYHIFGTDKIGRDVFYQTLKSIRTGLVIGTVTTLFMLPFALLLGTAAGYFRGWIDDIIQYCYITLSSIPAVLLISASVLALQVYMTNHSDAYPTLVQRADIRLLALCFILGITGWSDLCRFLRAETLKLRELEFVQAAKTLGVSQMQIILRHIIPNVAHIVIITVVLDFSVLVLAEAVLSYIGVGVDPTMMSWGNMINSSRLELAREPVVWWPLLAALVSMFGLVLSVNLLADGVRDVFDPYLRLEQ